MKKVYINEDYRMGIDLADAYCSKKSALFNYFFGWRESTRHKMGDEMTFCHMYKLPKAVANMIIELSLDETEVTVV